MFVTHNSEDHVPTFDYISFSSIFLITKGRAINIKSFHKENQNIATSEWNTRILSELIFAI